MNNGEIDCGELVRQEMPPTEARDWGRKEYQEELLTYIETKISELADEDSTGHVYWNQFKELVNKVKP